VALSREDLQKLVERLFPYIVSFWGIEGYDLKIPHVKITEGSKVYVKPEEPSIIYFGKEAKRDDLVAVLSEEITHSIHFQLHHELPKDFKERYKMQIVSEFLGRLAYLYSAKQRGREHERLRKFVYAYQETEPIYTSVWERIEEEKKEVMERFKALEGDLYEILDDIIKLVEEGKKEEALIRTNSLLYKLKENKIPIPSYANSAFLLLQDMIKIGRLEDVEYAGKLFLRVMREDLPSYFILLEMPFVTEFYQAGVHVEAYRLADELFDYFISNREARKKLILTSPTEIYKTYFEEDSTGYVKEKSKKNLKFDIKPLLLILISFLPLLIIRLKLSKTGMFSLLIPPYFLAMIVLFVLGIILVVRHSSLKT